MTTQERIALLEAHCKSRRGRRDFVALDKLVLLRRKLAGQLTPNKLDDILKHVYSDANTSLAYAIAGNPMFAMIKKEPRHWIGKTQFVVAVDLGAKEGDMAKAICPDCEVLQDITPNGADPRTTNKRQRIVLHKKPNASELCPGGGKDV